MALFKLFPLALLFGIACGSAIPGEYYNHAEVFAANTTSPADGHLSAQRNGNFVLVNQCYYDIYVWYVPHLKENALESHSAQGSLG